MERSFTLAPSLLSADFSALDRALVYLEAHGAQWVHLDVMDGHFVPNLTFGAPVLRCLRSKTHLPFDVHLMVSRPADLIEDFVQAGADFLTFHIEAEVHAHRLIHAIRGRGVKVGISLVPSTPVAALSEVLPFVDLVLVMTVNPGFSGQQMIAHCLSKVSALVQMRTERGYSYMISVDGGIDCRTLPQALDAGADVIVSGSAFFSGTLRSLLCKDSSGA
ncbi:MULTISPECIES: ribulose-phosphate 3-epimerase [Treponema]|uniref:Ribulose-phosphate 3-epimerase n=7 Tax=Treponema TaxID=157 RepID=RPE_TREPA|nr:MULTISPECIES: ribulose-phosphate 3-epimerase [Treponema]O66107.1 RecName: Full=Ribulose-phosphate 3-epimerase [Treponema pallidum subsp. pallidum str. Nichols]AAC08057.1 pentose-5-phosphate 3-epimerase homolog [Treponema pallidum]AAC65902.1 ribulose-phosphate 3-epimerase (cfxE) [Treponema pallidum subsp. pallidum str. Nichols]ACD71361.1 ribulose-phosphate 3-epimerase [Treponema pallidum subsp. pallidum SS14]ADD73035.1 ribulose-phosphate 3-epimerase [Treponema pallidum subsp. pallidum str. C